MDLTTVFMPGAQSLVTAIMTETWTQARAAVAKLWARHHAASTHPGTAALGAAPDSDPAALERASHELDAARLQALQLAGTGPESDRAARMQLFWAGYLAGQAAARPELTAAILELPSLLGASRDPAPRNSSTSTVHNEASGVTHGTIIQVGHVHGGGNTFGR